MPQSRSRCGEIRVGYGFFVL
ncbi:hypothetical protein C355_01596 [Cryptococcus neoformans Th84]|nr:hypothetical protein C355_01596 [Cryptococcus neoformans var. grubii Th84]